MKTERPSEQIVHLAEQQSHGSIVVQLKEEDEQLEAEYYGENPHQPGWFHTDNRAEIILYKEEEEEEALQCYDKDATKEETKTEEISELQVCWAGADGTLPVTQEDGGGAAWLTQEDHKLSESLRTARLSNPEGCQEDAESQNDPSDGANAPGQEASEHAGGGKCLFSQSSKCMF